MTSVRLILPKAMFRETYYHTTITLGRRDNASPLPCMGHDGRPQCMSQNQSKQYGKKGTGNKEFTHNHIRSGEAHIIGALSVSMFSVENVKKDGEKGMSGGV